MIYRVTLTNPTLGSIILTKPPKGIDEMFPTIKRGENHGLTIEIDVKLEFFCNGGGREFVDEVRETQGIDGEILIDIDAFCGCEGGDDAPDYSIDYSDDYGSIIGGSCDEDFEEFYLGSLDLKTWTSDDVFAKVNINPRGILQTVKNRLDTKVDLFATETLDGTAVSPLTYGPYDLTLHGKALNLISEFSVIEPSVTSGVLGNSSAVIMNIPIYPDISELPDTFQVDGAFAQPSAVPLNYYYKCAEALDDLNVAYRLKGSVTMIPNGPSTRDINFFRIFRRDNGVDTMIFNSGTITSITGNYTIDFDIPDTIAYGSISVGEEYFYYGSMDVDGGPWQCQLDMDDTDTFVTMTGESVTASTEAQAFGVFETGAIISRFITDQLDSFRSEYFGRKNSEPYAYSSNGCGSFRALLNGFLIRGFPSTGANARTIKMSMNDYFKGLNPIDNLGMGIEQDGDNYYVVVDQKSYFYDVGGVMLRLDNVPNLKVSEAPEYYYNRINVGYENWEVELRNGLDEVNSKRQFDTGIKSVDNPLDLISNITTSGYRLEKARRNQYDSTFTEDSEFDEEIFLTCLNRSVDGSGIPTMMNVCEKNENFTQVNNVISPETSYNLRLSPLRNMLRHSPIINAGLTKNVAREIKLTSGEGNYKMTSEFSADTCPGRWNNNLISEGANVQWDHADNTDYLPIWLPEILEFDYPVSFTQWNTIKANPKGVFEVSETDEDHVKAYILDFKYKQGDVSSFKLLRAYV